MHHDDPHGALAPLEAGAALSEATAAMVLIHGRGAAPDDLAPLADVLLAGHDVPVAVRLPQAEGRVWYPQRFIVPPALNQPWLDSARQRVASVLNELVEAGIPEERIVLGGFSQGACLALDVAARRTGRLGAVLAFAGGLIGDVLDPSEYSADLSGMPAFLGSSDPDPHIPTGRVEESAAIFETLGAQVDVRLYPGLGHTIGRDQIEVARHLVSGVLEASS